MLRDPVRAVSKKKETLSNLLLYLTILKAYISRKMAGAMGLEPTTFAVTGRRCNQLNYAPAYQLTDCRHK